eukprot:TRINITY_DN21730_c0_g1_i2.p1 TRINITY_DN21730_c0_g1~~TRINITY_DN21730_c0_g1_i2.p1  ORF type:complete len:470 (-),score=10.91 TRINITY_DN21730_c0_g1_i2:2-1411(-)
MKTLYELQRQTKSTAVGQLFAWQIPKGSVIPSKFKTFEWLANTMEIVHTYGVPRYQELTPTVWTFATFPFFVGIMFGDIAHGMIVLALSLYLYTQGYKPNNPLSQLYPYRLLILMIGISAVFCGFMYNEFLGLNAGFFGSCYNSTTGDRIKGCELPFGLDPIWAMSDNHIAFVNSLKMKLSIIFGVVQIILGIILKGFNDYFFEKWVTFFADFVPQLVFFLALFGFMVVVIFVKWMTPFPDPSESYSILTIFISTPLDKLLKSENKQPELTNPELQNPYLILLLIAIICVPILFFIHPFLLIFQRNQRQDQQQDLQQELDEDNNNEDSALLQKSQKIQEKQPENKSEQTDEIVTHTTISSIEFLLGTISNTASYLRLWALSLAHSQLSEVFFHQLLAEPIRQGNIFLICFGFFVFTNVTFGILICIDLLECFLHSLRLHWVEFQTKFFYGDGVAFKPLTFNNILSQKNQ